MLCHRHGPHLADRKTFLRVTPLKQDVVWVSWTALRGIRRLPRPPWGRNDQWVGVFGGFVGDSVFADSRFFSPVK
jgi:hypothetical protein